MLKNAPQNICVSFIYNKEKLKILRVEKLKPENLAFFA